MGDLPVGGLPPLVPELIESPTSGEQFVYGPVFDDAATIDKQHSVGTADAGQPVRNDHPGAWL